MSESSSRRVSSATPPSASARPIADLPRRASMARLTSTTPISIGSNHHLFPYRQHLGSNASSVMDPYLQNASPASRANRFNSVRLTAESAVESEDEAESSSSTGHGPPSVSYGSVLDDNTIIRNVSRHLPTDSEHSLQLQGGDVTRELYTLGPKVAPGGAPLRRTRSLTGADILGERRGSSASQLRVPGGFRREFLVHKNAKFGYELNAPNGLTRNFLEFLSIYGHFAGEDLEDEDFLACDYADSVKHDEETPLLDEPQWAAGGPAGLHLQRLPARKPSQQGKASTLKAFFLLLKAFVGTGVLFLPKAFSNAGLFLSAGLLVLFAALSFYCYLVLVQSKVKTGVSSFGDIGMLLYGRTMRWLILASIVLSQIGFVAAYIVFTAENLRAFMHNAFGKAVGIGFLVCLEAVFFVPMSLIRNITKLSMAALMANVFILAGLCIVVYYASADLIVHGPAPDVALVNFEHWTLFIGVAIFAFEGIGLIIPVEESMKHPEEFPKVLFAVVLTCAVLFTGMGVLGYLTYGNHVNTVIILSLPQDSPYVISIQFFYSVAIMFSVPLQLLPAIRIMETRVFKKRSGKVDAGVKWAKNVFRIVTVIVTATVAYFGSADLDAFVSFVGCFACIPLVYMYPPMLHLKSCAHTAVAKTMDISMIGLGTVALCYITYQLVSS